MTYLQRKKLAFMNIVNQIKGFVRSISGTLPLTLPDCVAGGLISYTISGTSFQNGTPTPDNPVDIESVGELVTDETDTNYGKYKIPITCSDGKKNSLTTNIYLDEPLRKVREYTDYIDFKNSVVIREVGVTEFTGDSTYSTYALASSSFYGFYKTVTNMKAGTRQGGFCTYLRNLFGSYSSPIWFGVNNKAIYFSLPDVYNAGSTTAERRQALKDWLDTLEEPFLVYYPLDTPTETPVKLPKLPTFKGETIYIINTLVQPYKMSATYYSTSKE